MTPSGAERFVVARLLYETGLCMIVVIVGLVIVADLWLSELGCETVSIFLRGNRAWFWWPAGLVCAFILGLGIHLYGPWSGGGQ